MKNKSNDDQIDIRDTLFGDMPISAWTGSNSNAEPWISFQNVKKYLESDNTQLAIQELEKIAKMPNLESRHYIQAWHFLKSVGVTPTADIAKKVYGVIVEVSMKEGLDIVAAYADHTARYFNYSGAAVIWECPDDSLKNQIDDLLNTGKNIINNIGPWEEKRPEAPAKGQVRVSMLTPSGLHFGQAPFDVMAKDKMGGPIINAALKLMQALINQGEEVSA